MADRPFRLGRFDHVHLRVPGRAAAAAWYGEHLGFETVDELRFWSEGFEGVPLQLAADGGRTTLALFEANEGHPMLLLTEGVAFSVELDGSSPSPARCPVPYPAGRARPCSRVS